MIFHNNDFDLPMERADVPVKTILGAGIDHASQAA